MKILFFLLLITNVGYSQNKRIDNLIQKEIKTFYNIETFTKEPILISKELINGLPLNLSNNNFFKINNSNHLLGYYYVGKAFGKTDYFDFMVIIDKDLSIEKVEVLIYREERGGEVASVRWLKQFNGSSYKKTLGYQSDIAAISGATISAKSITNQINKFLQSIGMLHSKNII